MKVWVYAIAKDERAHVERFMASCAGADGVYILDTGSTWSWAMPTCARI